MCKWDNGIFTKSAETHYVHHFDQCGRLGEQCTQLNDPNGHYLYELEPCQSNPNS